MTKACLSRPSLVVQAARGGIVLGALLLPLSALAQIGQPQNAQQQAVQRQQLQQRQAQNNLQNQLKQQNAQVTQRAQADNPAALRNLQQSQQSQQQLQQNQQQRSLRDAYQRAGLPPPSQQAPVSTQSQPTTSAPANSSSGG